jgi:hypothetical protein
VSFDVFPLDAGLLARGQYSEGPATGHLDTDFSRFPRVFKQTLRRFPTLQAATTCFSCNPPDVNLVANRSHGSYVLNNYCHRVTTNFQLINIILIISIIIIIKYDGEAKVS